MNNSTAENLINECQSDFVRIEHIIYVLTQTNPAVPYLTKYLVIKACGTLEQCFKTIISDFTCLNQNNQIINYIDKTFRESSINPSLDNIYKSLKKFDENWHQNFKNSLNNDGASLRIKSSIKSLNDARNEFAHGGNPNLTFNDVKSYFEDAIKVIEFIDISVC